MHIASTSHAGCKLASLKQAHEFLAPSNLDAQENVEVVRIFGAGKESPDTAAKCFPPASARKSAA